MHCGKYTVAKANVLQLRRTGRRKKVKYRLLGGTAKRNYIGLAIGAGIGIALFGIVFLSARRPENGEPHENHTIESTTSDNVATLRTAHE